TAHSVAVNAETGVPVGPERARELFSSFPGLTLWDDPAQKRYPMPVLVEGQDNCYVGRIRQDLSRANALNFWVVGDQLRKAAALSRRWRASPPPPGWRLIAWRADSMRCCPRPSACSRSPRRLLASTRGAGPWASATFI